MSKLIISGGTGFLGTNLISKLIRTQKIEKIWCITRDIELIASSNNELIEYINHAKALEIASEKKINGIIHLATMYKRQFDNFDPYEMWLTNVVYPTELLQAGRLRSTYFLNSASFLEFESKEEFNPSYYVSTKRFFSETLQTFRQDSKIKAGSLIIGDTFGEGDKRDKVLNTLVGAAKKGRRLTLDNPNGTIRLSPIESVTDTLARMVFHQNESILSAVSSTKISLSSLANFVYQVINSQTVRIEDVELEYADEVWNPDYPNNSDQKNIKFELFNFLRNLSSS